MQNNHSCYISTCQVQCNPILLNSSRILCQCVFYSIIQVTQVSWEEATSQERSLWHGAGVLPSGDMIFNPLALGKVVPLPEHLPFCFSDLWPDASLNLNEPSLLQLSIDHRVPCHRQSEPSLRSHVPGAQRAPERLSGVPVLPHRDAVGSSAVPSARSFSALGQGTWSHWNSLTMFFWKSSSSPISASSLVSVLDLYLSG